MRLLHGQAALQGFVDGIARLSENRKLQGHKEVHGLPISIENKVGSVRKGVDPDGEPWETKMRKAYGYIKGTKGVDGDALDCYVGDYKDAKYVYIIHVMKAPEFEEFDEDKCMLHFKTPESAKKCFNQHYDDPDFYGGMTQVPVDMFVKLTDVLDRKAAKLTAAKIKEWTESELKDIRESKQRPTIYYARSLQKYGTAQEAKEVAAIQEAFPDYDLKYSSKQNHSKVGMDHYFDKVGEADMVIASPLRGRQLTAGVHGELKHARHNKIPVRMLTSKGKIKSIRKIRTKEGGKPDGHFATFDFRKKKAKASFS